MTGYERIQRALNGQLPDRVPVMLHNFMQASHEAGYSMDKFRNSSVNMAKSFINAAEKYQLDGILVDIDTALLAGACGAMVDYPENEPARVIGPSGEKIEDILSKIDMDNFLSNERIQIYLEAIRIIRKSCSNELFIRGNADQGPFGLAFLLYGMQKFLIDILDEETIPQIKLLLEKCYQVCLKFHKEVYYAGAHCTSFGDSASGPDLVSPKIYKEFAKPYQKLLASELKEEGIKTICHICGCTNSILEDMAETGCAGYEIDYKTDIQLAKSSFKGKTVLFGNIDPSGVICLGSKKAISDVVIKLLDVYKYGGWFVIGAGCALPKETPEGNIRELVETVCEYGLY